MYSSISFRDITKWFFFKNESSEICAQYNSSSEELKLSNSNIRENNDSSNLIDLRMINNESSFSLSSILPINFSNFFEINDNFESYFSIAPKKINNYIINMSHMFSR